MRPFTSLTQASQTERIRSSSHFGSLHSSLSFGENELNHSIVTGNDGQYPVRPWEGDGVTVRLMKKTARGEGAAFRRPAARKFSERVSRPVTSLSRTLHRRNTRDRSFSVAAGAALRPRAAKQGQAAASTQGQLSIPLRIPLLCCVELR